MATLRRHQLAFVSAAGWAEVLARPWDAVVHDCLQHWAGRNLPLVVTRQRAAVAAATTVALGLPAPARWQRRRIAVELPRSAIAWFDEFPRAGDVLGLLTRKARGPMRALLADLAALGVQPRAYGSYGWQRLSDEDYVHADSDLDLWVAVDDEAQADAVAARLLAVGLQGRPPRLQQSEERPATDPAMPRFDGELVFPDGTAVAWREWAAWRAGRTRGVLVKRLHGPALETAPAPWAGGWTLAA